MCELEGYYVFMYLGWGGGKRELIFHRGELIDNIYNQKIKQEYISITKKLSRNIYMFSRDV